jgi:hypothetical protein
MRGIIYSDFSCHLYTIKKQENDDRLNFKSSKTISLINSCLKSRTRLFHSKLSFVIVSHSSCCFVSDLHSLGRVRIIEWSVQTSKRSSFLSNDLKTIEFFQIEIFEFYLTFEVFYFVFNSCTRKRQSVVIENIIKNVMMIDDDDQRMMWHVLFFSQSDNVFILFDLIIRFSCSRRIFMSCLSWSSFFVCLVEVIVRHAHELFIVKKFIHFWKCCRAHRDSIVYLVINKKRSKKWKRKKKLWKLIILRRLISLIHSSWYWSFDWVNDTKSWHYSLSVFD